MSQKPKITVFPRLTKAINLTINKILKSGTFFSSMQIFESVIIRSFSEISILVRNLKILYFKDFKVH